MNTYSEVSVVVAVKWVGSGRNQMVPLLQPAVLCVPAPQAAPADRSILHSTDRRALDNQEQTCQPAVL